MREPTIKGNSTDASREKAGAAALRQRTSENTGGRFSRREASGPSASAEIIGQRAVAERLAISLAAAKKRGEPLPHILFDGPPGLGKTTFATVLHNELGVELNITSGAALDKKMDVMPFLTNAVGRLDPLHRRDPSTAPRGRGIHLSGHGRLPGRCRARRGNVGAHHQSFPQEIHDHRSDDAQRHALGPAARAVRHARAPRVLRRRRPRQDHHDQRRQAATRRSSPRPRGSWPRAAAERLGSPTRACAGSATTPWPAPTGISVSRSPATPSTCKRSIPRDSISKTAAISKP